MTPRRDDRDRDLYPTFRDLHESQDVVEKKVDEVKEGLGKLDTRVKVGFAILFLLIASPKVAGGPDASQVVTAVLQHFA